MSRLWKFVHNAIVHPLMEVLPEDLGDWLHNQTGEAAFGSTPPVTFTASVYARKDGKLLLVNHRLHGWVPAGGRLEDGETPVMAAVREVEEELGWVRGLDYEFGIGMDSTAPPGLIAYEEHDAGPKGRHLNFSFLIEAKTDEVHPCQDEFTEVGWFESMSAIPGPVPPNVRVILSKLFQHDTDLFRMNWGQLMSEVMKLRHAIRQHRDSSGHDLCWYVPELWGVLPEKVTPDPTVPPTSEFLSRCALYRESLK